MKTTTMVVIGFGTLVVLGGALVTGANLWKSGLVVKNVVVLGNRVIDTNEILQLAHITEGSRLYDLDLLEIQRDVVSHYFLKAAVVERDPPSTVRITVTERTPVAMINTGEVRFLDGDGVVLPHAVSGELFDLPFISGIPQDARTEVGSTLTHPDIREALEILVAAPVVSPELSHLLSEIHLRSGGDVILYAAEGAVPILFGRGDAPKKLLLLDTFWKNAVLKQGSASVQYIDIRFTDQVVVKWKQGNTKYPKRS
jgi:cell division protein FtsQ